jgi:hyperosmotically inducible protein
MRTLSLALVFFLLIGAVASFAQTSDDDRIYDAVRRKLANDPDVKGAAFEVDVKAGVVTIKGEVDKEKFIEKAERLTRKVKGVKSVVNQVKVKK